MRRLLSWSLAIVFLGPLLSGCLLDQKEPTTGVAPGPVPFIGIATLEDVSGYEESSVFYAAFAKRDENPAVSRRALAAARFVAARDSAPRCEYRMKTVSNEPSTASATTFLSVGTIGVGPVLQEALETVQPDANNQYQLALKPNLPANAFQIVTTGAGDIKGFADFLTMPEDIGFPTANNIRFEDGLPLIQGNGISIEWNRPAITNAENILFVDFIAVTETEMHQVHCAALESAFGATSDRLKWDLPQADLSKFPVTGSAALFFTRAHLREVANTQVQVKLQGLRTQLMQAVIFTP